MGVITKAFGVGEKKKAHPQIATRVPKQGSLEEVAALRRAGTATRLRSSGRVSAPTPDEDVFIYRPASRRSKLFGE